MQVGQEIAGNRNAPAPSVLDRRTRERGITNPHAVERLLDDHRTGIRRGGDAVWALLNLELWYRTFVDGDGVQTLPAPGRPSPAGAAGYAPAGLTEPAA